METMTQPVQLEVWHARFNLDGKDNLQELPQESAVFGIFGIVHEAPVNCRYVASTDNLQQAVRELFENPPGKGMEKFMQGPWIQMLVYELMPGAPAHVMQQAAQEWQEKHQPKIDEEGEYPGYYDQANEI